VDLNSFAVTLKPGWNLVSFNLHPLDTSVSAVLSGLGSRYSLVYAWEAASQSWLLYDPNAGLPISNTLTNLDEKTGFWIQITSGPDVTLYTAGSIPVSTSIALSSGGAGWNLVGFPKAAPGSLRHDFALEVGRNLTHASDTVENGEKEVALWFKAEELVDWKREVDRWVFEK